VRNDVAAGTPVFRGSARGTSVAKGSVDAAQLAALRNLELEDPWFALLV
jgi:hypothetical protein